MTVFPLKKVGVPLALVSKNCHNFFRGGGGGRTLADASKFYGG